MPKDGHDRMKMALAHMEAAIVLLDQCAAPIGTAEHLDLAIHNLAAEVDFSGQARLRQLSRATHLAAD